MNCNELALPLKQGDSLEVKRRVRLSVAVTTDRTQHLLLQGGLIGGKICWTQMFTPLLTLVRLQRKAHLLR